MTLATWLKAMSKSRTIVYSESLCRPPLSVRAYRLDDEVAQLRVLRCPGVGATAGGALVLAVHQDHGYGLACFSQETGAEAFFTQRCLNWLSTFRFAD